MAFKKFAMRTIVLMAEDTMKSSNIPFNPAGKGCDCPGLCKKWGV